MGGGSAQIIREPEGEEPRILFMYGHHYRWAPLSRPWDLSARINLNHSDDDPRLTEQPLENDIDNNLKGYGIMMITGTDENRENYVNYNATKDSLTVWHTISSWRGLSNPEPYGVYTRKSVIKPWPKEEAAY